MASPWDNEDDLYNLADEQLAADKFGQNALDINALDGQKLEQEFDNAPIEQPPKQDAASLLSEYQKLQQERQGTTKKLAILDGLSQLGQAFVGRGYGKVGSNMDMFNKIADQPVKDYEDRTKQSELDLKLKDLQKARDPKAAAQARELAAQRGLKLSGQESMKDLEDLQKIGDPMKNQADSQGLTKGGQQIAAGELDASDETAKRDINSPITGAWQQAALKVGLPKEQVMRATAHDLEGLLKAYKEAQGNQASETFIPQSITLPDGSVQLVAFSNKKGMIGEPLGIKGYAPKTDLNTRTGEKETFIPGMAKTVGPTYGGATPQTDEQANLLVPEVTMQQLPKAKQDEVIKLREQWLADTKDERASLQASKSIVDLLAAGDALDEDIMRAVQNKFSIATGNKGATSENDVTPFGGRQSILDRVNRQMHFWLKGEFPADDRKFLNSLAKVMERSSQRELKNSTDFFSSNLYKDLKANPDVKAKNITQGSAEKLIGADVYTNPKEDNMIDVIRADGKKGKLPKNANTEKLIKEGKYSLAPKGP